MLAPSIKTERTVNFLELLKYIKETKNIEIDIYDIFYDDFCNDCYKRFYRDDADYPDLEVDPKWFEEKNFIVSQTIGELYGWDESEYVLVEITW